jgi:hypothetical protein
MTECSVFISIGGDTHKQLLYFSRFLDCLLKSDFTRDHVIHLTSGNDDPIPSSKPRIVEGLLRERTKYIPGLAQESDLVLMSDADMVVPEKWYQYVKRLFDIHPKLGAVAPPMVGDGYCKNEIQRYGMVKNKMRVTWVSINGGLPEAQEPGSDLYFPEDKVDEAWLDGFVIFRSEMLREMGELS